MRLQPLFKNSCAPFNPENPASLQLEQFPISQNYPEYAPLAFAVTQARSGHPAALHKLADTLMSLRTIHLAGMGVNETTLEQAAALYTAAANQGFVESCATAGYFHATGMGLSAPDREQGMTYLKAAAAAGNESAIDMVARFDELKPYQAPKVTVMSMSMDAIDPVSGKFPEGEKFQCRTISF